MSVNKSTESFTEITPMSVDQSIENLVLNDPKTLELNEEFNNFMKKVGEVSSLVRDMSSGDKERADTAQAIADQYLQGKVILGDDLKLKVKEDRTVINQRAFKNLQNNEAGEVDKDAWMAEVSKDAERRYQDKKIRLEKADTLRTRAMKAFRRQEYDKALSCYNQAINHIRDNAMLYCDRALTNIKLKNFDKVPADCDLALRLNEKSFKARLYKARAHKELEEFDKMEECKKELDEMFPQHQELIEFFLKKEEAASDKEEEASDKDD